MQVRVAGQHHYFGWPDETRKEKFNEYKQFLDKWKHCDACPLSERAFSVVLWRGEIPCEVLFIGEAPGFSEDIVGVPFIGPAGDTLNQIIELSSLGAFEVPIAITNTVCCIPYKDNQKIRPPKVPEIKACSERLREFVSLAQPELIVTLGKVSKTALKLSFPGYEIRSLIHPSSILQKDNEESKSLEISRCIHRIDEWVRDLLPSHYSQGK